MRSVSSRHTTLIALFLLVSGVLVAACSSQPAAAPTAAPAAPKAAAPTPAPKAAPTSAPVSSGAAQTSQGTHKYPSMTVRLGHTGEPNSQNDLDGKEFAKRIAEKSGGAIKINVYGSSQLGKQQELLQQVQVGALEMDIPSSEMVPAVGEFSIFDLPSIFKDRAAVKAAVEGPMGKTLDEIALKKNLVVLGYWENGFRVMTDNRGPIRTPADLKGLKIRVPPNDVRVKMFKMWGANAGPLNFSELFSALQTGVFDGQENPYAVFISAKLYEVQKYLSVTNHVYTPFYLVASPKWYNSLDDATKKLLADTAKEVGDVSRERGAKTDEDGRKLVESKGVKVNTDVDTKAFRDAVQPLFGDFEKKYGAEGKKLLDELKASTN